MVLKVPSDAGELGRGLDADLPQVVARPDPAPHEDRRRPEGAGAEHHDRGGQLDSPSFTDDDGAGRAGAVDHDVIDERLVDHRQVLPLARAVQICEGGAPAR
jgi:hypothetical protein